jgi:1,4-alpha-glucan branching enzyme
MFFEMADASVYDGMHRSSQNLRIDRAVALHKLIRLVTLATAGHGYLNFMGNEFGHPEWIDFPREGNGFSYQYCRRLWSLRDNPELRFHGLAEFDAAMLRLFTSEDTLHWTEPKMLATDDAAKTIAIARGSLFVLANFHSSQSHVDFPLIVPPGEYALALDTDAVRFGGQGRLTPDQHYHAVPEQIGAEQVNRVRTYLPARTAIVLRRCS